MVGQQGDFCSNPDLSIVLPFIEGFGAASTMSGKSFQYVPYAESIKTDANGKATSPLNINYRSDAVTHTEPILDDNGDPIKDENNNPYVEIIYDKYAENLDGKTPLWTWHVEKFDDNFASQGVVAKPNVTLAQPTVGGSLTTADKLGSVSSGYNRKFMNWRFTSAAGGNIRGTLQQGEAVVIELMMPIRADANSSISSDLMTTTGYAYKSGNYSPYIPTQQGNNKTGFILDTRDVNLDNNTNEMLLSLQLEGAGFVANTAQAQSKFSSSDLGTLYTQAVNGPVMVGEGGNYDYLSRAENLGASDAIAKQYVHAVLFDVLPYEGDPKVLDGGFQYDENGDSQRVPVNRKSTWHGWVEDLESVKVMSFDPRDKDHPNGKELLTTGSSRDVSVWVGPYEVTRDGKGNVTHVKALEADKLPAIWKQPSQALQLQLINEMREDKTGARLRAAGLMPLEELKAYVYAHPDESLNLRHALRGFWVQAEKDSVFLPPTGYISLAYDMHAPLNLPKYLGSTTGDALFDMNLDITDPNLNPDGAARLAQVTQWNSFAQRVNVTGADAQGDASARLVENRQAGAVVAAPDERGYVGDYVWVDLNWDKLKNDTKAGLPETTDAQGRPTTYHKGPNGRYMLATDSEYDDATGTWRGIYDGVDEDGNPAKLYSADMMKDLDFDGQPDDPGVNGVVVELLNENGFPVNRDNQVAVWLEGAAGDGSGRWIQCDPVTGEPLLNAGGGYINADAGAPYTYTTESDYYGNQGYWIMSNIVPGKYKLRFTFPKKYAGYTLTTLAIGPDKDGDGEPDYVMDIEHRADDPDTPDVDETALVATTSEAFEIRPVEYDKDYFLNPNNDDVFKNPERIHRAYDAEMTSYQVGISAPVTVEGVTFRDDMYDGGIPMDDPDDPSDDNIDLIDGYLDRQKDQNDPNSALQFQKEQRLANMQVSLYEYDPETGVVSATPALDAEDRPATVLTDDTGEFSFIMKPDRYYLLRSEDALGTRLIKPTPYLYTKDPLEAPEHNSLLDFIIAHWKDLGLAAEPTHLSDLTAAQLAAAEVKYKTDECAIWDNDLYLKTYVEPNPDFDNAEPTHLSDLTAAQLAAAEVKYKTDECAIWDNDLYLKTYVEPNPDFDNRYPESEDNSRTRKVVKGECYPIFAAIPTDEDGHAVYEDNEEWKGFKVYRKFGLGYVDATKGYLGNYVWNDMNYNGVQDLLEPGVPNVRVTLEQYWWNPNARGTGKGAWQLVERTRKFNRLTQEWEWAPKEHATRITNNAGQYVFAGLPTYVPDPLDTDLDKMDDDKVKYLAGYRLRIDRTRITNNAGQYVFAGLPTYVPDPLDTDLDKMDDDKVKYLAGYRLRIDRKNLLTLGTNWGFTYRNQTSVTDDPADEQDSDLKTTVMNGPLDGVTKDPTSGAIVTVPVYYLNAPNDGLRPDTEMGLGTDSMIVLAGAPTDETLPENTVTVRPSTSISYTYDLTNAQRFENWDAGLVAVPEGAISGVLWEDADYDGIREIDPGAGDATDPSDPGTGGTDPSDTDAGDGDDGDEPVDPDNPGEVEKPEIPEQVKYDKPMPGEKVVLTQWYWDPAAANDAGGTGAWRQNLTFGADLRTSRAASP